MANGPPHRPGEGRKRRNPAGFYWHPCRESARVASPAPSAVTNARMTACASPSISPTSRRTPAPFCGFAPAWESRRTLFTGRVPDLGSRLPPRRNGLSRCRRVGPAHARGRHSRRGGGPRSHRLVLFTHRRARCPTSTTAYRPDDVLLFGRELAGVPAEVHELADARLLIPMRPGLRSLNVAVAAAMAAGEALRQVRVRWP